ncbi:FAD-dependent oxidoreductase [Propionibacterium australiense]|uniref:FAD-dependent oxidoreductase n=1 Tax=Propionibacterium australiense TaxID=119981 RepID=A0A8B3FV25_9ACTN|nr:FAD-dependent oxidoreductase [Propionibacterium australiense]
MTHRGSLPRDAQGVEYQIPGFAELTPPCVHACGAHEPVREWVLALRRDDEEAIHRAWTAIVAANPLPATMGRICYADCERNCNRDALDGAVSIRELEGRVGDYALARGWALPPVPWPAGARRSARVTVVGSGPCGLSAASRLARAGHQVVLWEAYGELGGLLRRSISEERLPRAVLDGEIARIVALGVDVRSGQSVRHLEDVLPPADGVIWATGASMCMALVVGRTLWRQPVHTKTRPRRTASLSIGRGLRAAEALDAYLAGAMAPSAGLPPVSDVQHMNTGYFEGHGPVLPSGQAAGGSAGRRSGDPTTVLAGVCTEAGRCMSCGSCMGCDLCHDVCPFYAINLLDGGGYEVVAQDCESCGICVDECPTGTLRMPSPDVAVAPWVVPRELA